MTPLTRFLAGPAALLALLAPAAAQAQIHFSADVDVDVDVGFGVHIGGHGHAHGRQHGHGHVVVEEEHHEHGVSVVAPPVAVHPPAPPVVVVPTPAPSHQVVVVTPAPPAPAPPPQPPRAVPQGNYPPPTPVFRPHRDNPAPREPTLGLRGSMFGIMGDDVALGGASGALRFRPTPRFALDLGAAGYGGIDWADRERAEGAILVDGVFFLNPGDAAQLYAVGGLALSWGAVQEPDPSCEIGDFDCDPFSGTRTREMAHVSGSLGAGLELRLSPFFAVHVEARALLRRKVADTMDRPEFVESVTFPDGSVQQRSTDTSAGAVLGLGATLYL